MSFNSWFPDLCLSENLNVESPHSKTGFTDRHHHQSQQCHAQQKLPTHSDTALASERTNQSIRLSPPENCEICAAILRSDESRVVLKPFL